MRRTFAFALVASWVVLVAVLVRKQAPAPSSAAAALPSGAIDERDEWFGVYHGSDKVGHAHRVTARTADGYAFYEDSVVALAMLGTPQTVRTALATETDHTYALRRFRFSLISPATVFSASGTSNGHTLAVRYGPRGQEANLELSLKEPIYLPSTLRPRVLAGDRKPGTRYTVPVFSPLALHNEPMTITIEGTETLSGPSGPVETIRLREEHGGLQAHAWVAADGAVVREEAALGFILAREDEAQALADSGNAAPVDLAAEASIPLDRALPDPRNANDLALRLGGDAAARVPEDGRRQRRQGDVLRIVREALPPPAAFPLTIPASTDAATALGAAPFLEADDPVVAARAREIVGDASDARTAAQRLVAWVADTIEKAPTVTVPSAREGLTSGRADCN